MHRDRRPAGAAPRLLSVNGLIGVRERRRQPGQYHAVETRVVRPGAASPSIGSTGRAAVGRVATCPPRRRRRSPTTTSTTIGSRRARRGRSSAGALTTRPPRSRATRTARPRAAPRDERNDPRDDLRVDRASPGAQPASKCRPTDACTGSANAFGPVERFRARERLARCARRVPAGVGGLGPQAACPDRLRRERPTSPPTPRASARGIAARRGRERVARAAPSRHRAAGRQRPRAGEPRVVRVHDGAGVDARDRQVELARHRVAQRGIDRHDVAVARRRSGSTRRRNGSPAGASRWPSRSESPARDGEQARSRASSSARCSGAAHNARASPGPLRVSPKPMLDPTGFPRGPCRRPAAAPGPRPTARGNHRASETSFIHDTAVGQSCSGAASGPTRRRPASASDRAARSRPRRATAATWRQPKCARRMPVEQRAHAEPGGERRCPARPARTHLRRPEPAASARCGVGNHASGTTRARAPTRASPTRTGNRPRRTAAPTAATSNPSVTSRLRAGPTSKRSTSPTRQRRSRPASASVAASAPISDNDHGASSATPITPPPTARTAARQADLASRRRAAPRGRARAARRKLNTIAGGHTEPATAAEQRRARRPCAPAARRGIRTRRVDEGARSGDARARAAAGTARARNMTSGPRSPCAIASRPTGFDDVRDRGDDRGQRRAGERARRGGTHPTCRAGARRRPRTCGRDRRGRSSPSSARPSSRRPASRASAHRASSSATAS